LIQVWSDVVKSCLQIQIPTTVSKLVGEGLVTLKVTLQRFFEHFFSRTNTFSTEFFVEFFLLKSLENSAKTHFTRNFSLKNRSPICFDLTAGMDVGGDFGCGLLKQRGVSQSWQKMTTPARVTRLVGEKIAQNAHMWTNLFFVKDIE
jgi:hypothetical protein